MSFGASLGTSGPGTLPEDKRECRYGPHGQVSRALRDVPELARHEPWGELLLLLVTGVTAGAFFVVRDSDSQLAKVVTVLEGLLAGVLLSALLLFVWGLRPTAWKRHWRVLISPRDRPDGDWHTFLSLKSRHWHTVVNLTCVVTDPDGKQWRKTWKPRDWSTILLSPGHSGGPLVYPNEFGAPWPEPGKYKVERFSDVEHGTEPIRLARKKWNLTALPAGYSSSGSPSPS